MKIKETIPRWSIGITLNNCNICGKQAKETSSGNMTKYKYRCINNHTWGINENTKNNEVQKC